MVRLSRAPGLRCWATCVLAGPRTSISSGKAIAGHGCQSRGIVGPAVPSHLAQVLGNMCTSSIVVPVPFVAPRERVSQDTVLRSVISGLFVKLAPRREAVVRLLGG